MSTSEPGVRSSSRGGNTGMVGSARSSTWSNRSSSDCRQLPSWARASASPGRNMSFMVRSWAMSWPTASGCAAASAWSVSHASVRKIVVKMLVPAAKQSQSRATTSNSASLSARSIAASISGWPEVRSRPMVRAGAPATVNPGSSSLMPVMSPSTVAAIGPTVSRLGASGQTPAAGTRPWVVFRPAVPQHAGLVPMGSIASSCRLVLPTIRTPGSCTISDARRSRTRSGTSPAR